MRILVVGVAALLLACGGTQAPAEVGPGPNLSPTNPAVVTVPDASTTVATVPIDAGAAPRPAVVQRCVPGAWDPAKGCTARSPWVPPENVHNAPIDALERKYAAQRGSVVLAVLRDQVGLAVAIARKRTGKEQVSWNKKAVESYDKLRANSQEDATGTATDLAAEAEYAVIVAHIASVLPDETKRTCPAASGVELFGGAPSGSAPDAPKWPPIMAHARMLSAEFDGLARKYTSVWSVVALARSGVLYAHVRSMLAACDPKTMPVFRPDQAATIAKLRASGVPELAGKAQEVELAATSAFTEKRARELTAASEPAARKLMMGLSQARAFGFAHPVMVEARKELSELGIALGADGLKALLSSAPDVLDPDIRRTLATLVEFHLVPPDGRSRARD